MRLFFCTCVQVANLIGLGFVVHSELLSGAGKKGSSHAHVTVLLPTDDSMGVPPRLTLNVYDKQELDKAEVTPSHIHALSRGVK